MQVNSLQTKQDIAKHFKVSTRTVDEWTRKGKIPAVKIGKRCVRFDLEEVMLALTSPLHSDYEAK